MENCTALYSIYEKSRQLTAMTGHRKLRNTTFENCIVPTVYQLIKHYRIIASKKCITGAARL
jgi:hypothetical protein